jgi:hypothetical protein
MNALQKLIYQLAMDDGLRAQLQTGAMPTGLQEGLTEEEQKALLSLHHVLSFSSEALLKRLGEGLPDGLWDMWADSSVSTQVA